MADFGNHRVQKFSPDGELIDYWGTEGTGNGQFHAPRDVAVDSAGNVYVADQSANRIQKFDSGGGVPLDPQRHDRGRPVQPAQRGRDGLLGQRLRRRTGSTTGCRSSTRRGTS